MMAISSRLKQRGLALLILAGVIAVAWVVAIHPFVDIFVGESDGVKNSLKLLSRYEALVTARPQIEAELRELQQRNASASGLVEGSSTALAAARLQSDIKAIVENNGGTVLSSQNLPSTMANDFEKIEIQYDITMPLGSLKNVVYQLETHTPYLFLDGVDMRMPENWQPQSSDAPAPKLEVQWTVHAYRWVGAR